MKVISALSYASQPEQKLDLYLPEAPASDCFLYFHGGGLTAGTREWGRVMAKTLTDRGIALASADYRMMPDHRYPAFVQDAALAAAYLKREGGASYGFERIFLGGSSAGGYLSMMLCFDPRWLGAHGLCATDFAGFLHDAGQPTVHYNVLALSGQDPRLIRVDESAPIYHLCQGREYPPMHFVVSDGDLPGRYEQTMLMLRTLAIFGHTAPEVTYEVRSGAHCHYNGALDENGRSELGKMVLALIDRA